jgi:hypothetical protein
MASWLHGQDVPGGVRRVDLARGFDLFADGAGEFIEFLAKAVAGFDQGGGRIGLSGGRRRGSGFAAGAGLGCGFFDFGLCFWMVHNLELAYSTLLSLVLLGLGGFWPEKELAAERFKRRKNLMWMFLGAVVAD